MTPKDLEILADNLAGLNADDDTEFRRLLNDAMSVLDLTPELTKEFGFGRPTVGRWIRGDSAPHPEIRKPIITFIEQRLRQHASIMRGLADSATGRTSDMGDFSQYTGDDE